MKSGGSKVDKASSSSGLELRSDDDTRHFLFMFFRREDHVYLLYRIDIDDCFEKDPLEEVPLSPLIVFSNKSLTTNSYFAFAFLEPYFYFIGGDKNKIFTITKSQLLKMDHSKKQRGSDILQPLGSSMNGTKLYLLAFTFQNKLYVISKGYFPLLQQIGTIYIDFEVYSPETNSWIYLGNKPLRESCVKSHLVHHDMVYFTTTADVVLSFNLVDEKRVSIFDPYGVLVRCPEFFPRPRPNFDTDIQIIGDVVFGGIYFHQKSFFDICASPSLIPSDDMFLRPSLTHDEPFYNQIYTVPRQLRRHFSLCSKSLVTIDNDKGIICIIIYGNQPWDQLANYAVLNFFRVNGDSYQGDIIREPEEEQEVGKELVLPFHWTHLFYYAHDKDGQHINFFKADFLFATFMPIDTNKQVTPGVIYSSIIA
ncbi:hypothetical protein POM88_052196 [Heracleum sosnowskyi]|uniref:Uncharacterized protein n=1 Tax=Heracleum sosnowskyi TaxID=360622 RepID=A0AAD8GTL1_9APIA|nr:hypothetical protein POM88_052196 [Heracleum sosnowskyi]